MTSRLGRSLVVPTGSALSRDPLLLTDFEDGVEDFDLVALGEPSIRLPCFVLESVATDRRAAYGSAVAGRLSSGRRGFAAGRTGAEESEDREVPVGTVRTDDLEEGGAEECLSDKADCADSGRGGGTAFAGASRAFLCAAIASFRAERPASEDVLLASPLREGAESVGAFWCEFGLEGSFSNKERDLGSRFERILFRG
jgi:hypothetical protein